MKVASLHQTINSTSDYITFFIPDDKNFMNYLGLVNSDRLLREQLYMLGFSITAVSINYELLL